MAPRIHNTSAYHIIKLIDFQLLTRKEVLKKCSLIHLKTRSLSFPKSNTLSYMFIPSCPFVFFSSSFYFFFIRLLLLQLLCPNLKHVLQIPVIPSIFLKLYRVHYRFSGCSLYYLRLSSKIVNIRESWRIGEAREREIERK